MARYPNSPFFTFADRELKKIEDHWQASGSFDKEFYNNCFMKFEQGTYIRNELMRFLRDFLLKSDSKRGRGYTLWFLKKSSTFEIYYAIIAMNVNYHKKNPPFPCF